MSGQCPICKSPVPNFQPLREKTDCKVCGKYYATEAVLLELYNSNSGSLEVPPNESSYLLSGVIREKVEAGETPILRNLDELKAQIPFKNDPLASIDRILLYIYQKSKSSADHLQLDSNTDYPIGYSRNPDEFIFFIEKAVELGYLESKIPGLISALAEYQLSLKGWGRVSELRRQQSDSRQAFVAMWFHEDLNIAFSDGFQPALKATGYRALRIDMSEHNEKIDDRIIAEIRKSGLLIADFTGQRGGVYFEAGFAMGLGIPVIWTCRSDYVESLHFDTRQYNHIVWTYGADLKEKLQLRIEASLPNRPK